jgi:hypothetical protein
LVLHSVAFIPISRLLPTHGHKTAQIKKRS